MEFAIQKIESQNMFHLRQQTGRGWSSQRSDCIENRCLQLAGIPQKSTGIEASGRPAKTQ